MLSLSVEWKTLLRFTKDLMNLPVRWYVWTKAVRQHIKEVRKPISAGPGKPERYDTEYERNGVSNMFMFFEPCAGWRHVVVTDKRTAVDWADQIREVGRCPLL